MYGAGCKKYKNNEIESKNPATFTCMAVNLMQLLYEDEFCQKENKCHSMFHKN